MNNSTTVFSRFLKVFYNVHSRILQVLFVRWDTFHLLISIKAVYHCWRWGEHHFVFSNNAHFPYLHWIFWIFFLAEWLPFSSSEIYYTFDLHYFWYSFLSKTNSILTLFVIFLLENVMFCFINIFYYFSQNWIIYQFKKSCSNFCFCSHFSIKIYIFF